MTSTNCSCGRNFYGNRCPECGRPAETLNGSPVSEVETIDNSVLLIITMLFESQQLTGFFSILAETKKLSKPQLEGSLLRLREAGKIRYESRLLRWVPA